MKFLKQFLNEVLEALTLNEEKYSVLFDNEVEKKIPRQGTQSGDVEMP